MGGAVIKIIAYVICMAAIVFVLIRFLYPTLMKAAGVSDEKKRKDKKKSLPATKRRYYSTEELLPYDGIGDNILIMRNGNEFSAAIRCDGFDYFMQEGDVQDACMRSYRSMIDSFQKPFALCSSYRSCDVSGHIRRCEKSKEQLKKKEKLVREEMDAYSDQIAQLPIGEIGEEYTYYMQQYQYQLMLLKQKINHIDSLIAYLETFSDDTLQTYHDIRYAVSTKVNPDDYGEDVETQYENVKQELQNALSGIYRKLKQVGISSRRDSTRDLLIATYRQCHPSARRLSDEQVLAKIENAGVIPIAYAEEEQTS